MLCISDANDPDSIRVASAGLTDVDFDGGPIVKVYPRSGYYYQGALPRYWLVLIVAILICALL